MFGHEEHADRVLVQRPQNLVRPERLANQFVTPLSLIYVRRSRFTSVALGKLPSPIAVHRIYTLVDQAANLRTGSASSRGGPIRVGLAFQFAQHLRGDRDRLRVDGVRTFERVEMHVHSAASQQIAK